MKLPSQDAASPASAEQTTTPSGLDVVTWGGWPLTPLYPVRWKEPEINVIIKKPPPGEDGKQKPGKTWIEIRLINDAGDPVPDERYILHMPDGKPLEGTLDPKGRARIENIDPGPYTVSFPDIGYTIPV